ncbi:MAG: hypothetical protein WCB68_06125 [Pyrinomonadaceae bacterium]
MSDFLNNLIGRSYGLKPVAQPRLASRFEPVQGSSSALMNQDQEPALETEEFLNASSETGASRANAMRAFDAVQSVEASRSEEETPGDLSQRASRTAADSNAAEWRQPSAKISLEAEGVLQTEGSLQTEDALAVPSQLQNPARPDNQSRGTQTTDELRAEAKPLSSSLKKQDAVHPAATVRETGFERENVAPPEQQEVNAQAERRLKDSQTVSDEPPSSNISEVPQHDGDMPRRAVAPLKVSAQSNAGESLERAAPLSLDSHSGDGAESSSPTIRVTIGRIDVRAVMPDSKPAPRAAASSAPARKTHGPLSLEEYLKQRNGGKR